jgi:hypothetical protein
VRLVTTRRLRHFTLQDDLVWQEDASGNKATLGPTPSVLDTLYFNELWQVLMVLRVRLLVFSLADRYPVTLCCLNAFANMLSISLPPRMSSELKEIRPKVQEVVIVLMIFVVDVTTILGVIKANLTAKHVADHLHEILIEDPQATSGSETFVHRHHYGQKLGFESHLEPVHTHVGPFHLYDGKDGCGHQNPEQCIQFLPIYMHGV